ncbi:helix-turn-helix transcriptional regulator [Pseudomonas qingdaonensis]|jgi:transcriptional regulator with XRE-family HTH domain|uniref:helix-turn-helix domain-containing protein n=1 Tax=Pseudomonas qingdaonensis TaxID=2056231 RepID=UPI0018CA77FA|nr:helix-turn-helix transcriptional regulator [Pseudomonas qingdaonensis]MBG8558482.1 helix-turn-helix transcriptional regulator [Pseudomonas qingdaonensis]
MKKTKIQILFGQRVRLLRKLHGWSQESLAARCGLDRTYISGIERGIRNPTLEIVLTLATSFEMELDVFFDWDGFKER